VVHEADFEVRWSWLAGPASAVRAGVYDRSVDSLDGAVRIAWVADGFRTIDVYGRWRDPAEVHSFARDVADIALLNRTVAELRSALRRAHPGEFELVTHPHDAAGPRVIVRLNPPPGQPNPDDD